MRPEPAPDRDRRPRHEFVTAGLALLLFAGTANAQGTADDPLMGERVLGDAAELVVIWSEPSGFDEPIVHQDVLDFLSLPGSPDPDVSGQLQVESTMTTQGPLGSVEGFFAVADAARDAVALDLDGDEVQDLAAIWEGPGGSVNLILPRVRSATLDWVNSGAQVLYPAGTLVEFDGSAQSKLRIEGGYFDEDPEQEFLVAYRAADSALVITLYDTNGGFTPQVLATADDIGFAASGDSARDSLIFGLDTGDVDGDGLDEIVVAWAEGFEGAPCAATPGRCWRIWTKAYDYDPDSQTLTPGPAVSFFAKTDNSLSLTLRRMEVAAGDFDADAIDEVAIGFHVADNSADIKWFLQTLDFDEQLAPALAVQRQVDNTNGSRGYPLTMHAADMDRDGRDEILYVGRQFLGFQVDDALDFTQVKSFFYLSSESQGFGSWRAMAVADLDADQDLAGDVTGWTEELVFIRDKNVSTPSGTDSVIEAIVTRWGSPADGQLEERARLEFALADGTGTRQMAIVAADLGGNGIRVGTPQRFRKSEIAQPIVVLNAPPTHFDIFGGTPFDINRCYNANIPTCPFSAVYEKQNFSSMEVETTVRTDWGVTVRAEGGFTIPLIGVGVEVSMAATHGETFSKTASNGTTFQTTETITAVGDDRILATVSDYDIWEYPVLLDGAIEGYVAVVRPVAPRLQWFPSKSWTASTFIPVHEVGNILSYPNFGTLLPTPNLNPAIDEAVTIPLTATTLDAFSNSVFRVDFSSFSGASTTKEVRNKISGSVDFDIPLSLIPDIGVDGEYGVEDISTHESTVGLDLSLEVALGGIDTNIGGGTGYTVRPYSYWGSYGALVVDYAVQPQIGGPGFQTWWQEQYGGASDPAFLLPFRYDFEKGLSATPAQRNVTRDILLDPGAPAPGEEVRTTARIQNYSLLATPGPVEVRFFIGDPGASGTAPPCGTVPVEPCRIVGIGGETEVLTSDADGFPISIPAQGSARAVLTWRVPIGASYSNANPLRLYGVIDPDQQLAEVHETNNKGFVTIVPVPEPATLSGVAAALTGLLALARVRSRTR